MRDSPQGRFSFCDFRAVSLTRARGAAFAALINESHPVLRAIVFAVIVSTNAAPIATIACLFQCTAEGSQRASVPHACEAATTRPTIVPTHACDPTEAGSAWVADEAKSGVTPATGVASPSAIDRLVANSIGFTQPAIDCVTPGSRCRSSALRI